MKLKLLIIGFVSILSVSLGLGYYLIRTFDTSLLRDLLVQFVQQETGRTLHINSALELSFGLAPEITAKDICFENAKWGSVPEMIRVESLEFQLDLTDLIRKKISITKLRLVKPEIVIDIDPSGKLNTQFQSESGQGQEQGEDDESGNGFSLSLGAVSIQDGRLVVNDGRSEQTYAININEGKLTSDKFSKKTRLAIKGAFNAKVFNLDGIIAFHRDSPMLEADLTLEALSSTVDIKGTVALLDPAEVFDLNVSVAGDDAGRFMKTFGLEFFPGSPFRLAGTMKKVHSEPIMISGLELEINDTQVSGDLSLGLSGTPKIHGVLRSPYLNVRDIITPEIEASVHANKITATPAISDRFFSTQTFDKFYPLEIILDVDLNIDKFIYDTLELSRMKTKITYNKGCLAIRQMASVVGDGNVAIDFDLSAAGNNLNVNARASIRDLGLSTALGTPSDLKGKLGIDIDVKGKGSSVAGVMAGLSGSSVLSLEDATISITAFKFLGTDLTTSMIELLNPGKWKTQDESINCAVVAFEIQEGRATSQVIFCDTPHQIITADGTIDLATEEIDFRVKSNPKEGLGLEKIGKISITLNTLAKSLKLGGTLKHPKPVLNQLHVANIVGKALLGPVGIAWLMVSKSSANDNPCVRVLQEVYQGNIANLGLDQDHPSIFKPLKTIWRAFEKGTSTKPEPSVEHR